MAAVIKSRLWPFKESPECFSAWSSSNSSPHSSEECWVPAVTLSCQGNYAACGCASPRQTYCRGCNLHACLQSPCFLDGSWKEWWNGLQRLAAVGFGGIQGTAVFLQPPWVLSSLLLQRRARLWLRQSVISLVFYSDSSSGAFFLMFIYDAWSLVYVVQHILNMHNVLILL